MCSLRIKHDNWWPCYFIGQYCYMPLQNLDRNLYSTYKGLKESVIDISWDLGSCDLESWEICIYGFSKQYKKRIRYLTGIALSDPGESAKNGQINPAFLLLVKSVFAWLEKDWTMPYLCYVFESSWTWPFPCFLGFPSITFNEHDELNMLACLKMGVLANVMVIRSKTVYLLNTVII